MAGKLGMTHVWLRAAILGIVAVLCLWASAQAALQSPAPTHAGPSPDARGDISLYGEVADRVARGEDYYSAVATLHRERVYPLRPFYVVRFPTLAWIASAVSARVLIAAAWLLLLGAIVVWVRRLKDRPPVERFAALLLLTVTGAPLISDSSVQMHEFWCGLLLTIALGIDGSRHRLWQLGVVTLALCLREFAAAFLVAMLASALLERDRRGSLAIVGVLVAAAGMIAWHAAMVGSVTTAADLVSPGWNGLGGPILIARALATFSWLLVLPGWAVAILAFLPLLGWATLRRDAPLALLWFGGFAGVIGVLARPDNLYWAVVLLPAYPLGLAFVPRFLAGLGSLRPRLRKPPHPRAASAPAGVSSR